MEGEHDRVDDSSVAMAPESADDDVPPLIAMEDNLDDENTTSAPDLRNAKTGDIISTSRQAHEVLLAATEIPANAVADAATQGRTYHCGNVDLS